LNKYIFKNRIYIKLLNLIYICIKNIIIKYNWLIKPVLMHKKFEGYPFSFKKSSHEMV